MDKVFRAAAMIAVPFIHLSILYCSSQPDHEFFCHSLDSIWVITFQILPIIGIFFFQLCQAYSGFLREWLTTLQFPQGKEASGPRFGWTTQLNPPSLPLLFGYLGAFNCLGSSIISLHNSIKSSFSASLVAHQR